MAILHHKEEKIQVVLGRLPKNYTNEQFVEMFIKLYSKDWGKIKSAYVKQSQDKEPGTVINMPKPDLYLKQLLDTYNIANAPKAEIVKEETVKTKETPITKPKVAVKKKEEKVAEINEEVIKKPKVAAKKKIESEDQAELVKKPKAVAKKKVETKEPTEQINEVKKVPAKVKKAKTIE